MAPFYTGAHTGQYGYPLVSRLYQFLSRIFSSPGCARVIINYYRCLTIRDALCYPIKEHNLVDASAMGTGNMASGMVFRRQNID